MGIGVLRALRPGRRAPCDGKLLDLPVLQLVRKAGEPFRRREADLHVDAPLDRGDQLLFVFEEPAAV